MPLAIGQLAPDFTLPDENGHSLSLSSLRGQTVIVYFYPKDDTPGCTTQACGFRDHYADIQQRHGLVLGISPDGAQSHQKFKTKFNLPFTLLSDEDHAVADQYGVWGEKQFMGRKYLGVIRSHFVVDPDGRLADVQVEIKPKDSVAQALAKLGA